MPGPVTVTSRAPHAAVVAIVTLVVSWVAEFTVVLLTVIPAPKLTAAPEGKLLPQILEGYGVGVVIERTCARPGRDQGMT